MRPLRPTFAQQLADDWLAIIQTAHSDEPTPVWLTLQHVQRDPSARHFTLCELGETPCQITRNTCLDYLKLLFLGAF